MLEIDISNSFKSYWKKHIKGISLYTCWIEVLYLLLTEQSLPSQYRDHQLTGNLKDFRECHIKPDLLLVYRYHVYDNGEITLGLYALCSHSELQKLKIVKNY